MRPWAHICTQITKCMFSLGPNAVCFWRVRFSESHAHLLFKKIRKLCEQNVSFWRMILLMFLFFDQRILDVMLYRILTPVSKVMNIYLIQDGFKIVLVFLNTIISCKAVTLRHICNFKRMKTVCNSPRYLHKVTRRDFNGTII